MRNFILISLLFIFGTSYGQKEISFFMQSSKTDQSIDIDSLFKIAYKNDVVLSSWFFERSHSYSGDSSILLGPGKFYFLTDSVVVIALYCDEHNAFEFREFEIESKSKRKAPICKINISGYEDKYYMSKVEVIKLYRLPEGSDFIQTAFIYKDKYGKAYIINNTRILRMLF